MKGKSKQGSITVFLSMIMLIILSLILTLIELARVSSAYARANEITYMALDSCFSSYAREIFEDYGIMVLWKNESEFSKEYLNYVNKNSNYKNDFVYKQIDLYGVRQNSNAIEERKTPLDDGGENIYNQICEYMKIAIAEDILDSLVDSSKSLSQNSEINVYYDKLDKCTEKIEEMEYSVEQISINVEQLKKTEQAPGELLVKMREKLEEIKCTEGNDDYSNAVRDNLFEEYKQFFRRYSDWQYSAENAVKNILVYTNDYQINTENAKAYSNDLREEIDTRKNNIQSDIYSVFSTELNDLDENILNQEKDVYNVISNKDTAIEQGKIINNVVKNMENIMEETKELDYSYNKLSNYDNSEILINNSYIAVSNAIYSIKGYDSSKFNVNYDTGNGKKQKNVIYEFVKKIKKDGALGYVVEGKVSQKKIVKDELPSNNMQISTKDWKKNNVEKEFIKKVLVGQYILDKFGNASNNRKDKNLDYEVEYVLYGNDSDRNNLSEVTNKIVLIREGFNLISIAKDSIKKDETYSLALAITGFSGMPAIVRITQFIIMGAWAYAESVVDVKNLLAGEKVNLIKSPEEWNLSLNGVTKLQSKDDRKKSLKGLSYEDYLRFMLLSQNESEQICRVMDIIQMNIQSKYNKNFMLSKCIVETSICTEYKVKRVFSFLGFVRRYIVYKDDKFIIKVRQKFGY